MDRGRAIVFVLAAAALAGCATGSGGGSSGPSPLSDWSPPEGQTCYPSPALGDLPEPDHVVDVAAVADEVRGLPAGHVLLDIHSDSLGQWSAVGVVEGDLPAQPMARAVEAVSRHFMDGGPNGRLELRVDLGEPPEVRLGPHSVCPPALANREDAAWMVQQVGQDVGIAGTVVLWFEVKEDGSVGDIRIRRSSGHMALDGAMMQAARRVRFHPALHERQPVPLWAEVPFNVVVRR